MTTTTTVNSRYFCEKILQNRRKFSPSESAPPGRRFHFRRPLSVQRVSPPLETFSARSDSNTPVTFPRVGWTRSYGSESRPICERKISVEQLGRWQIIGKHLTDRILLRVANSYWSHFWLTASITKFYNSENWVCAPPVSKPEIWPHVPKNFQWPPPTLTIHASTKAYGDQYFNIIQLLFV